MDCYGYALLAAGHVDLVIEAGLAAYDICAPIAVIEAAGGIVTDWEGGPVHDGGRTLAAANETLHARALEILERDLSPLARNQGRKVDDPERRWRAVPPHRAAAPLQRRTSARTPANDLAASASSRTS